jgi:hypothetical protein
MFLPMFGFVMISRWPVAHPNVEKPCASKTFRGAMLRRLNAALAKCSVD